MAVEDKDFITKQSELAAKGLKEILTKASFDALFSKYEQRDDTVESNEVTENDISFPE